MIRRLVTTLLLGSLACAAHAQPNPIVSTTDHTDKNGFGTPPSVPIREIRGQPSPRVAHAATVLGEALSSAKLAADRVIIARADSTAVAALVSSGALKIEGGELRPEGFVLATLADGRVAVVGADDSGVLYGCLELARRVRETRALPAAGFRFIDAPVFKLRGPCIGMQKTYILPGRHVYEYPYTPEEFPFFYDRAQWIEYLDFLAANRMNTLYLWNGHPFASLVKLADYPEALEVSEETFARNVEMFRFVAQEADRRGIWVVQMFYNIILSKPFAEKHGLATQLKAPHPVAADYTRKSIAEFVRQYPNVGLMVCLGEALQGLDNQVAWCTDVILPGVKDGMKLAGLTAEPPVVIRTHATDARVVMPAALKVYGNLYTEAKFNGESLTTWEPRGVWQGIHQDMSRLGSTHLANVHILANLEPFRYGATEFIRKSMLASRDRLGAHGLHLYPLAYWNWPDSPDKTAAPLKQIERDWIWFEAWARYAWNPDLPPAGEREHWIGELAARYGSREAAALILDAYNDAGECAPRLLRRYGITEGNRQTLSLGMTLDELVHPEKYRPYAELWLSQSPEGERLDEFVAKELAGQPHTGETPVSINREVREFSARAVAALETAAPKVTRNREEFARLLNDARCIQALAENYAAKAETAGHVLRYEKNQDPAEMFAAEERLGVSLAAFRRLTALTRDTYRFANTMQTSQRRIPVTGGLNGQPANYHWTQLLPTYEQEFAELQQRVADIRSGKAAKAKKVAVLKPAAFTLLSPHAEVFSPGTGSRAFKDQNWEIQFVATEIHGLKGIRFSHADAAANRLAPLEFECAEPVRVVIGYVESKDKQWRQPPDLETDAHADGATNEPLILKGASIDTLPNVQLFVVKYPAGRNKIELRGQGSFLVLGVAKDETPKVGGGKTE